MVPTEEMARGKLVLRWEAVALSSAAPSLVEAIESKLKEEEWLVSAWSPVHLNRVLNQWYFKEGVTEVSALKVWQDSCQYLYLPRLMNADVFVQAVAAGCSTRDGFGYATGKEGGRWLGFGFGQPTWVTLDSDSLLVSHDAAARHQQHLDTAQRERSGAGQASATARGDAPPLASAGGGEAGTQDQRLAVARQGTTASTPAVALPHRFFGTVEVDATRATMDFSTIVNEVIQHFAAQSGVDVTVTVEIEARTRQGFEAGLQRAVKENCGVLKFRSATFEQE